MPIFNFIGYLAASLAKHGVPCYNHLSTLIKEVFLLKNNELFSDTMDKINSLAKSRGFVNGINWARTAAGTKLVNELELSAYENIHTLRNLMAHGSARDISISNETLSEVLGFLSKIMSSTLRPAPVASKEQTVDFSNQSFVQPGDIIFLPFFQGFVDFSNGGNKPTEKYSDAAIHYRGDSIPYSPENPIREIAGIFGQVDKDSVTFFVNKDFKFVKLPGSLKNLYYIVLRPNDELKAMILNRKDKLFVTEYKLSDDRFSFKAATARDVNGKFKHYDRFKRDFVYHNITSYEFDFSNYNCRASCVKVGFTRLSRTAVNKDHFKLKSGMFLAFPPKGNQPYADQIDLRYIDKCYFVDSWSSDPRILPETVRYYGVPHSDDNLPF